MALDPNISLNIAPVPQIDLTRIQQLRNLMGQEALMGEQLKQAQLQQQLTQAEIPIRQAQLPGAIATAEVLQTQAAAAKRLEEGMAEASKAYARHFDPLTGRANEDAVYADLIKAGFRDAANMVQTQRNAREAEVIKNTTDLNTQREAIQKVMNDNKLRIAATARNAPANEQAGIINRELAQLDAQFSSTGQMLGTQLRNQFFTGTGQVNKAAVDAIYNSSITAREAQELALAFNREFFTPEGRNPNSQVSKNMRQLIIDATKGTTVPPETMSANDMYRDMNLRGIVGAYAPAQIFPAPERAKAFTTAARLLEVGKQIDLAQNAALSMPKEILGAKPTVQLERLAQQMGASAALEAVKTAVVIHNREFPESPIDPMNLTVEQQLAKLSQAKKSVISAAQTARKEAETPTFPTKQEGAKQDTGKVVERPVSGKVLDQYIKDEGGKMSREEALKQLQEKFGAGVRLKLVD